MKASPHRQAILVFGIAIPLLLLGIAFGGVHFGHAKLKRSYQEKVANLERYNTTKAQAVELEAFLTMNGRRDQADYWKSKLGQDLVESFTENLDKILAKYEPEVLRQTEIGRAPATGGFGSKTDHPYSKMQLRFEGGFKPMQLLLAELETEMPNLVLESLTVAPKPSNESDRSTLQFGIVYHCWEMPKDSPAPVAP